MTTNAECARCGVTAADLPYEDLGMTLDEASEFLFDHEGNTVLCQGCAACQDRQPTVETDGSGYAVVRGVPGA